MDIESAKIAANLLRAAYKLKLIDFSKLDKTIDQLQILVFKNETKAP